MAPPLGLHWAAETFVLRVRGHCVGHPPRVQGERAQRSCEAPGRALSTWPKIGAPVRPRGILDRLEKPARVILDTGTKNPRPARAEPTGGLDVRSRESEEPPRRLASPKKRWPRRAQPSELQLAPGWSSPRVLVIFMQAGFLFLEIGFSRGKNVGSGVAKIFVNFSIATIVWWAFGFALAFGGAAGSSATRASSCSSAREISAGR